MLDISRDKTPKLETLFDFVDFMAGVKLNQLQLYIEGFPFAYPSFPQVWQAEDPLTGEDIIELNADLHASEAYRRAMVPIFTRRALAGAMRRA